MLIAQDYSIAWRTKTPTFAGILAGFLLSPLGYKSRAAIKSPLE